MSAFVRKFIKIILFIRIHNISQSLKVLLERYTKLEEGGALLHYLNFYLMRKKYLKLLSIFNSIIKKCKSLC